MADLPRYTGTGITREQVFEPDDPAAADIMERGTVEGLCAQIERECFAIMRAHDLPDRHWSYYHDKAGNWTFEMPPGGPFGWRCCNDLSSIVRQRGYEPDSTVGFAAGMLCDVVWLRRALQVGEADWSAMHAFYLGIKWAKRRLKRDWEAFALKGQWEGDKQKEGADARRLADDAERSAIASHIESERGKGMRDAFRIAAERHPHLGGFLAFKTSFYKKVSKPSE